MPGRSLTEAERLATVERDLRDHAKSLSYLTDSVRGLDTRILVLEEAERTRRILEARMEERDVATNAWRKSVDKRFESISGNVNKLLWLVAGVVVTAFVAWVLRGGLVL